MLPSSSAPEPVQAQDCKPRFLQKHESVASSSEAYEVVADDPYEMCSVDDTCGHPQVTGSSGSMDFVVAKPHVSEVSFPSTAPAFAEEALEAARTSLRAQQAPVKDEQHNA